ncbi:MAG: hypothetical protein WCK54_19355 [Desulfuromonadales bacterium]
MDNEVAPIRNPQEDTILEIKRWREHLNFVLGPIGVCAAISLRQTPSIDDALLYLSTMFTFAALMQFSLNSELFMYGQKLKLKKHEKYNWKILLSHYKYMFEFKHFLGYWAGVLALLIIVISAKVK